MQRGHFITFEGGDGAGKSTQMARLAERLVQSGRKVLTTREPGGSPAAEAIRRVLLSGAAEPFGPVMEALLFAAARADHIEQVIRPAVGEGTIVLCDRFLDSSRVYQGVSGGVDADFMRSLERVTVGDMIPDLTLILDVDPQIGLQRAAARAGNAPPDRYEKEDHDIQRLRRQAFLNIALAEPDRCVVIDASRDPQEVALEIERVVERRLGLSLASAGGDRDASA